MIVRPIANSEIDLVAGWMAAKENYQWLDFGSGKQILEAVSLRMMMQRPSHCLRAFSSDSDETPIGIVALSNVDHNFKTATVSKPPLAGKARCLREV